MGDTAREWLETAFEMRALADPSAWAKPSPPSHKDGQGEGLEEGYWGISIS